MSPIGYFSVQTLGTSARNPWSNRLEMGLVEEAICILLLGPSSKHGRGHVDFHFLGAKIDLGSLFGEVVSSQ